MEKQLATGLGTVVKNIAPLMIQNGKGSEIARIAEAIGTIESAPVCLLVCGEFKRGKSTFVNGLIGRNLCATDTDICTSVVSKIMYADRQKIIRYYGDFSDIRSEEITIDDLERYTVGSAEEIGNTIFIEMQLPLESLKNGLVIIDTPGVGGLDPRHAALTNHFLPQADITMFVTDVNEPLSTTELTFYKTKVLPYSKHSVIVVNKSDLRDRRSVEDFRQDTINKISEFTQTPKESINAVAVSAAAEAWPDQGLGDSNFDEIRKLTATLADRHRRDVLASMKSDLAELIDAVIAPLDAQLRQIDQPDVDQLDALNRQKEVIDRKLAELVDPNSAFRKSVTKEITARREEISNYLNEASVTLQSETFNKILHAPEARAAGGGRWMGTRLNDEIAGIASEITLRLETSFKSIAAMPQFEGMLDFETKNYSNKIVIRDVDTTVPLNKRITPLMSGAGIVTLGCSLLTGVGLVAAVGIGAYVALKNSMDSGEMYIDSNLSQVYRPQLSGAVNSLNTYVNSRFQEFQQEWIGIITDRAKTHQKSVQESIAGIQQVKSRINQAVTQKAQIQCRLKPFVAAKEALKKIDL